MIPPTRRICLLATVCASAWAVGLAASSGQADPPASQPDAKPAAAAIVNGEVIPMAELLAALPEDSYMSTLDDTKKVKLDRLVETTLRGQFFASHKVVVSDEKMDEGIRKFEEMVKTPGCPCCGGGYANLDAFMKTNWFSMKELRQRVRNDISYQLYFERSVAEGFNPDVVKARKAAIEKDFVKGSVMFFDFWEDADYNKDPKAAEARTAATANSAWKRLQKGEPFDAVAKSMRGDSFTGGSGGKSVCYEVCNLEDELKAAWLKLTPETFSAPVKTLDGYRIVKRETLTEPDVERLIKNQVTKQVQERIQQEYSDVRSKAKIEYPGKPAPAGG